VADLCSKRRKKRKKERKKEKKERLSAEITTMIGLA